MVPRQMEKRKTQQIGLRLARFEGLLQAHQVPGVAGVVGHQARAGAQHVDLYELGLASFYAAKGWLPFGSDPWEKKNIYIYIYILFFSSSDMRLKPTRENNKYS